MSIKPRSIYIYTSWFYFILGRELNNVSYKNVGSDVVEKKVRQVNFLYDRIITYKNVA